MFVEANDYLSTKNYIFSCHTCNRFFDPPDSQDIILKVGSAMARYRDLVKEEEEGAPNAKIVNNREKQEPSLFEKDLNSTS